MPCFLSASQPDCSGQKKNDSVRTELAQGPLFSAEVTDFQEGIHESVAQICFDLPSLVPIPGPVGRWTRVRPHHGAGARKATFPAAAEGALHSGAVQDQKG
mmetsp:Transcript_33525/g.73260  ORF Transcript_33525/g.73260 Transcript_33525/m.73260 type:complete len:101 (-) Transcript_33525:855-1157(-)